MDNTRMHCFFFEIQYYTNENIRRFQALSITINVYLISVHLNRAG
jgi:hypothetical protein